VTTFVFQGETSPDGRTVGALEVVVTASAIGDIGTEDLNGQIFEHACIPGTVTNFFLKNYDKRTIREKNSRNFLTPLTNILRPDDDCWVFDV